ncbi:MAG: SIMPL domain-containing protein [Spirochaetales bacterium]|nr:SIMPL domain-containing protein [Spirochaetales bacterium]
MRKTILILISLFIVMFAFTSCQALNTENKIVPTVSVSASATVTLVPDSASFSITSEATEPTTEGARNASSMMVEKAVNILKDEFGITEESFTTDFMQISPYYEWVDGTRTLVGQKATQKLSIVLSGDNLSKVGKVYDRLSILDGISISSVSYSKLDTTEEEALVREMAAQEALSKAEAYAKGLGKRVGEVITVSDGSKISYTTATYNSPKLMVAEASADYYSTTIYQGDVSLSDSVTVVFTLVD